MNGFLNFSKRAYILILLTAPNKSLFLAFINISLDNFCQFSLALLILYLLAIYLATRSLQLWFCNLFLISFHLLKYLLNVSLFLVNIFIINSLIIWSLLSFFFLLIYIFQFLIIVSAPCFLAVLSEFSFQIVIIFFSILFLKLSGISKAPLSLLSKAVFFILSKHSFKVFNLWFFKSSLNLLKIFLLFSDLILSKTYLFPNLILNNLLKPLFILNLLFNSFSSLHFCKISLQKPWITRALSWIAIILTLLSHLVKYIYSLLLDVLCFWIVIFNNKSFIFLNLFFFSLALELKYALWIVEALSFSFLRMVSTIVFHFLKYLVLMP